MSGWAGHQTAATTLRTDGVNHPYPLPIRFRADDTNLVGGTVHDGSGGIGPQLIGIVAPRAEKPLGKMRLTQRLARDIVDRPTDGTHAVDNRGRPAQHFDAIQEPGIDREGHGAGTDVEARA